MSGFTARQEVVAFRYVELRSATLAAMGTLSLLDREMFAEAEAARLLQLHQSTLHYWLEGREMRGRHYQPIIRPAATGSRIVTWAEFIEAGLLRSYRSSGSRWRSCARLSTCSARSTECPTLSLTKHRSEWTPARTSSSGTSRP